MLSVVDNFQLIEQISNELFDKEVEKKTHKWLRQLCWTETHQVKKY